MNRCAPKFPVSIAPARSDTTQSASSADCTAWTSAIWRSGFDAEAACVPELAAHLGPIAAGERERFLEATSIDALRYGERFSRNHAANLATLFKLAGIV